MKSRELSRHYFRGHDFLFWLAASLPHRARRRAQAQRNPYIHAEGYPAGEMKHGPNALIDQTLPVVILATATAATPSR
jgi:glucosamine--fructose-6-phosphate aminotransferase (isomerizing)